MAALNPALTDELPASLKQSLDANRTEYKRLGRRGLNEDKAAYERGLNTVSLIARGDAVLLDLKDRYE